uniref:Uncharacterized protein n=1 Tax=Mucochytrium quahogii TaxID=96639 RepID=A0A7S2W4M7_9STRA|mmetsp:Transcript_21230/g.34536  ORF Transcript_21230/g.34536 Transcript_21230/m.34536 type:complete len:452 (+) Transcript_21230:453-1808(+)|eukprot:CAMPEP_0203751472 /NCGR_PEP_ID=MMETSP0098-20131031/5540_1 /ASSEMBLY_ACC=CAM_ASM_000208 /TAXON_ID=96639 /ORGANISM=" , Strain NY0313808BC1" /LENGTH=451 /DNA_ID=CAMNT_0050641203 /DNA_START=270 /DNA_END=1625 /DNA_ORIENTATION=-
MDSCNGCLCSFRTLLQDTDVDVHNMMSRAAETGNAQAVGLLLRITEQRDQRWGQSDTIAQVGLNVAAKHGNCEVANVILDTGRGNKYDKGNTALEYAAGNGHVDMVNLLLKRGAALADDFDNISIRVAAKQGHVDVVRVLLESNLVDPGARGNEALIMASENGHIDVVKLLLNSSMVDPAAGENKAILVAVLAGHVDIVKHLLEYEGVMASQVALKDAIERDDTEMARVIIESGTCPLGADNNQAIRLACSHNNLPIVKLLLHSDDVDPSVEHNEPLRSAASSGNADLVRLLLTSPRVNPGDQNNVAIREAALYGNELVVKLLLDSDRVDPSVDNNYALRKAQSRHIKCLLACSSRIYPTANAKEVAGTVFLQCFREEPSEFVASFREKAYPFLRYEIIQMAKHMTGEWGLPSQVVQLIFEFYESVWFPHSKQIVCDYFCNKVDFRTYDIP